VVKVVIADADIDRRFKIKLILRNYNCEFFEARNYHMLLDVVLKEKPDISIIDFFLKIDTEANIYDVLQKIKEKHPMPIIVLLPPNVGSEKEIENVRFVLFPEDDESKRVFINAVSELLDGRLEKKEEVVSVPREKKNLKKILIADDDKNVRLLLKTYLKDYDVYEAKSGIELEEMALELKPDLIITDVIMPGTSAWKAIKKIRESEDLKDVPVIFASGYVKDKEIYEVHKPQGPSLFILKPFRKDNLFDALKKFFILT